jgi:hypothetical protein
VGYNGRLARLALLSMAGLWLEAVVPDWSGLYLQQHLGAAPGQYGLGNLIFYAALAAAQIPASTLLSARFQYLVIVVGGASFAGGMALATAARTLPIALVGLGLCGAGAGNIQPFAMEAAQRLFGGSGAVIVRIQTPGYLGLALEKPVTGFLAGAFTLRRALASTILIAITVCGLGVAAKTKAERGRTP